MSDFKIDDETRLNFDKMLKSQKRKIKIDKRRIADKFKPIDGAKLADILTKRNRGDSSSDEELKSFTPTKKIKSGGRRTRRKKRTRKKRKKRTKKRLNHVSLFYYFYYSYLYQTLYL